MKPLLRIALAVLGALSLLVTAGAGEGRRIFIAVDMEGIAGVVSSDQLGPEGFEYARFRELMTEEANAAIAAAREAGATSFVVADSHGNFENLLLEKLPADVEVVRGGPRPLGMMQGIGAGFDGAIFIGYHASTVNPQGVRAHTFSSANLADVRLNGRSVSEGAWGAALAAHFGVPVLAVSGDEAAVREVQSQVPGAEGAIVKWPYGFHSARSLSPEAARQAIREAVRKGMAGRARLDLLRAETPIKVEVRFKSYRPAELASWLPGVERVDAHAVRFTAKDMPEAARWMAFLLNYRADLQP
jgi:D-amino peptidase